MSPAPRYKLMARFTDTASVLSMHSPAGGMCWSKASSEFQRINEQQERWLGPDHDPLIYSVEQA